MWLLLAAACWGLPRSEHMRSANSATTSNRCSNSGALISCWCRSFCLALFLLSFLRRFEAKRSRIVDIVADTSFATFFLHPLFIEVFVDSPLTAPLLA